MRYFRSENAFNNAVKYTEVSNGKYTHTHGSSVV